MGWGGETKPEARWRKEGKRVGLACECGGGEAGFRFGLSPGYSMRF